MDSKVTVFLIVMLLAVLRGLMQRSQVRREIEERKSRGLQSSRSRRLNIRVGPVVDPDEEDEPRSGVENDDDSQGRNAK